MEPKKIKNKSEPYKKFDVPVLTHSEQDDSKLKIRGVSLCAILDTAHPRKDGTYTIRIRVIYKRISKLYSTKLNLTLKDYLKLTNQKKTKELASKSILIFQVLKKAYDIILKNETFNFFQFEKEFYGRSGVWSNVFFAFNNKIKELNQNNQFGSEQAYKTCEKHFKEFLKANNTKSIDYLSFEEVTPQWLIQFEKYMLSKNVKKATIGVYLRSFRAVYNLAIEKGGVNAKHYPFGKNKYSIPSSKAKKDYLKKDELSRLFHGEPQNIYQEKAKDFWFFSYFCNGMNIKDIANITYNQIDEETLTFYRQKTQRSTTIAEPVIVYLNSFTKNVIKKYSINSNKNKNSLVFNIINKQLPEADNYKLSNNFNRFVSQHFTNYAKSLGINKSITPKWARNSFATNAILNGASIEQVSEALSHTDIQTTKIYFKGFSDDAKKHLALKMFDL